MYTYIFLGGCFAGQLPFRSNEGDGQLEDAGVCYSLCNISLGKCYRVVSGAGCGTGFYRQHVGFYAAFCGSLFRSGTCGLANRAGIYNNAFPP